MGLYGSAHGYGIHSTSRYLTRVTKLLTSSSMIQTELLIRMRKKLL